MEFEQMVRVLRPKLLGMCRRFFEVAATAEDAEDIVQETFLRLWQRRQQINDYLQPEAFATRIAKNLCIDHYRAMRRQDSIETVEVKDQRSTDARLLEDEAEKRLQRVISRLSKSQQRLLQLRSEGMTLDEMAAVCGLTKNSTKTLLSAARKQIIHELKENRP